MPDATLYSDVLSFLTLVGGVLILLFLIDLLFFKKVKYTYFKKNVLFYGLIFSLFGTLGSLYYSEILNYAPCKLCWIQRILMYPQVILFSVALLKKDNHVFRYIVPLSVIGLFISGYHYLLQLGLFSESISCSIVGYSVSCSETFFLHYGYISIPMMAFTAFALILTLGMINRYEKKKLTKI